MPTELLALAALPWVLIAFYQVGRRAFVFLLLCLLLAPIVTYLVQRNLGGAEVYQSEGTQGRARTSDAYLARRVTISLADLLQPHRALIAILFTIMVLNTLSRKSHWVRLDRTEIWMAVFSTMVFLSVMLFSQRSSFALRTAIDGFFIPFLAYYFTRRLVTSTSRFLHLTQILACMGFYVAIFCLVERLTRPGLFYRISGPFESGNTLHVVMSVVLFGVWTSLPLTKNTLIRFCSYVSLISVPIIIALSLTRGNWVGFLLGTLVFIYLSRRLINSTQLIGASGSGLLLVCLLTLGVAVFLPEELFEMRIGNPDNLLGRFATWKAVAQEGLKAPVFGIGLNNLSVLLRDATVQYGEYRNYLNVHNSYLSILAELGVLGLLVYLRILLSVFQNGLRLYGDKRNLHHRRVGVAVVAIMVSYLAPAMFANTLYITGLIQFYVYVFIGAVAGTYGTIYARTAAPYRVRRLPETRPLSAFRVAHQADRGMH